MTTVFIIILKCFIKQKYNGIDQNDFKWVMVKGKNAYQSQQEQIVIPISNFMEFHTFAQVLSWEKFPHKLLTNKKSHFNILYNLTIFVKVIQDQVLFWTKVILK